MRDQMRPEAAEALRELGKLGISRTLMVTGDVATTAKPIAQSLGISEVHAECRPEDKVHIISGVRPRPLIIVGDGLNNAPVLTAADVGFAMGACGATAASGANRVAEHLARHHHQRRTHAHRRLQISSRTTRNESVSTSVKI